MPVFFAMLSAPGILLMTQGMERDIPMLFRNIYNGIDSFPLMAIPFFMLAGELMNRGGITLSLVNFSQAFIGHVRGGLAHVNVLSSMLFAGLSGSAVADTSAIGSMMIPAMEKNGYSRRFSAAITAASSVIGPIIPPSGIMIIYAYTMEVSVAALFAAGVVPGILVGLGLMAVIALMARKYDFPVAGPRQSWPQRATATRSAFLPLLTPAIILGGILGGIFTPTEASAIAVGYALVLSIWVMKTVKIRELPGIFTRSAQSSAVVLLLVGAAIAFKTVVSLSHTAEFNLRAVANSNENDEDYDGLVVFKDFVEAHSNGRIAVELYIGTQLCANGTECMQALEDGSVDVFISTASGVGNMFPYVQVLDLPYLLRDDRVAETVLAGDFTRELRTSILEDSDNQVRLMTIGNTGGWRNFANTKHTIKTPRDIEGLKIRTVVSDLPQELVKSLGASPTPIPWPELFTSFQTGVVEGSKNGITDIMSMKFPEAGLKYITLDGHAYMSAYWFMNNERFLNMPDDMRRVIVDGFSALQQATFASPKRKSIKAYQDFNAAGGEVYVPTPEQKDVFKKAAEPVYSWFKGSVKDGEKWFDLLAREAAAAEQAIEKAYASDLN